MRRASLTGHLPAAISFVVAAGVVLLVALRGGGSYDLVVRNEEAILVWVLLGAGIAVGVLPQGRWTRAGRMYAGAFAALAGWTALAFLWTSSAERTTIELSRTVFYVGIVVLGLSAVTRKNRSAILGGLFAGAAITVLLAFLSRLYPDAFPVNHVATTFTGTANRLSYPFGYWNAVGCLAAMVAATGLAASVSKQPIVRSLCLAAVPVAGVTAYLTYSRGAVIAIVVATLVAIALSRSRWVLLAHLLVAAAGVAVAILVVRRHDAIADATGTSGRGLVLLVAVLAAVACAGVAYASRRLDLDRRLRLAPAAARIGLVGLALVVVAGAAVAGPRLVDRAWDSFSVRTPTITSSDPAARLTNLSGSRRDIWESALHAFDAEPLHGIGPGTFEFWWDHDPDYTGYARDAHSLYFETLGELGVVGLLLVVATIAAAFAGAVLASRRASMSTSGAAAATAAATGLAAWATFAFYDWMWESTAVAALALAAPAVAMARTRRGASARLHPAVRVAAVLACVLALLTQLPPLASTSQVRGSEQAAARGDLQLALARANDAVGSEPWGASPYLQRALVEELGGALTAAARDARRAAARQPGDYRPWLILSRIEAKRGRVQAALAAYRHAVRIKPVIAPS